MENYNKANKIKLKEFLRKISEYEGSRYTFDTKLKPHFSKRVVPILITFKNLMILNPFLKISY